MSGLISFLIKMNDLLMECVCLLVTAQLFVPWNPIGCHHPHLLFTLIFSGFLHLITQTSASSASHRHFIKENAAWPNLKLNNLELIVKELIGQMFSATVFSLKIKKILRPPCEFAEVPWEPNIFAKSLILTQLHPSVYSKLQLKLLGYRSNKITK